MKDMKAHIFNRFGTQASQTVTLWRAKVFTLDGGQANLHVRASPYYYPVGYQLKVDQVEFADSKTEKAHRNVSTNVLDSIRSDELAGGIILLQRRPPGAGVPKEKGTRPRGMPVIKTGQSFARVHVHYCWHWRPAICQKVSQPGLIAEARELRQPDSLDWQHKGTRGCPGPYTP